MTIPRANAAASRRNGTGDNFAASLRVISTTSDTSKATPIDFGWDVAGLHFGWVEICVDMIAFSNLMVLEVTVDTSMSVL